MANMQARLHGHAAVLRTGAAFIEACDSVSRNEWETFISHQRSEKNSPGIQGIGYAMIIPGDQLEKHELHIRESGFHGYSIHPAGKREIYTSIIYIEPFSGRNLKAFGYDMYSEPIRREAMQKACDLNTASLSGKVILVQETDTAVQSGTLMYVPVYKSGLPINTVAERRRAIKGWCYSPYRMNDFMYNVLDKYKNKLKGEIRLQIYDNDSITPDALIFYTQTDSESQNAESHKLKLSLLMVFDGKQWTLHFSEPMEHSSFYLYSNVFLVLISGTAISFLIFILALLLLKNRYRLKLTTQLAGTLKANLDKQVALYNAIPDAVFVTDTETGRIEEINHQASVQYGYTQAEFASLKSSDLETINEQKETAGDANYMHGNHLFHKKKGGDFIPVEISSSIFEIHNYEKTIVVARDISKRYNAEQALRASEELYKSTVKASPDGIIVADLKGQIILASPAAFPIFGYQITDNILGRQILEFIASEEHERTIKDIETIINGKLSGSEFYKCRRKDGSLVETEIDGELILSTDGQPNGFVFVIRDITERKRAEKALRESEEKWRSLVSNSPDFIALHDKDGNYLFLNHFAEGFTEKDILGHTVFEFLAPQSKELFKSKFDECISTWMPVKFEHVASGNFGGMRMYEETFVPILTKNEGVNILAVAKDITEQKLSERKLQESEEHFRLIFEDGSIAMALVNADIRFTQVNKAFVALLGYSEAELLNMTFVDISDSESTDHDIRQIKRLLNREIALYRTEIKFLSSDKKTVWGLVQISVMYGKEGEFLSLLIMINNITIRKKAEEALVESQEIFNQFMLNSPIYVFFKDAKLRSLRLSRNFEQMLGRPLQELLGKSMDELFPSELARKMLEDDFRVLKEGKLTEIEEELNGRYYSTTKFPIYINDTPMYLAGYTIDVTSRKLAADAVKAALKEKEILLREVHHRVKNNLQVVSSLLNLQANKIPDKAIKGILEQSRNRIRSIALVHEKLYQTGNFAEINIKEYTRSLLAELFRVYLSDPQKIHIRTEIENVDIPLVYAIPYGLILNEIISNSLKYAFPDEMANKIKPEIFIRLKTLSDNSLQLIAGDNGIGLPDDYQATDSLSLGLYLIRILATEQLNGGIEIDNKKGTIFTITFNPLAK